MNLPTRTIWDEKKKFLYIWDYNTERIVIESNVTNIITTRELHGLKVSTNKTPFRWSFEVSIAGRIGIKIGFLWMF